MLCSLHWNNDRNGNHIMKYLIDQAMSIMDNFDWYWRMRDSDYKNHSRIAEIRKNRFLQILKEINDTDIIKALRDIWTAHYEMSLPYMDEDFYKRKKEALNNAKEKLKELTEVLITI